MPSPITPELLERFHQVSAAYTVGRLGAAGLVHRDGAALQWMHPAVPVGIFNTAFGLGPDDEGQLERVLGRFAEANVPPRLEVLPHQLTPDFGRRLAARGLVVCDTRALMYAETDEVSTGSVDPTVGIEAVDARNFERFVRVDQDAGGNPEVGPAERFAGWLEHQGLSLQLATVSGEDAGVGILHLNGDTGYLASVATLPRFRRCGVQLALIRARCLVAREAGVRWVFTRAGFGTTSQRNLQRAGLQLAAMSLVFG